jgi:hypothetical protein
MKIVFLDFDGVICTRRAALALGKSVSLVPPRENIDPVAVALVNRICLETGAKIVISSSWRTDYSLRKYLEIMGFSRDHLIPLGPDEEIWRTTPSHMMPPNTCRGDEIQCWINDYGPVEAHVILDDQKEGFWPDQEQFLVVSPGDDGLNTKNYLRAIEILGKKNDSTSH